MAPIAKDRRTVEQPLPIPLPGLLIRRDGVPQGRTGVRMAVIVDPLVATTLSNTDQPPQGSLAVARGHVVVTPPGPSYRPLTRLQDPSGSVGQPGTTSRVNNAVAT